MVGNLAAIVQTRSAVTLSELGSALCGPAHAEAGTQRPQRAVHHQGWKAEVIEEMLWEQAEVSRKLMEQRGETPLCIWDSSVLEKPESVALEGLCSVRSSRVRRMARLLLTVVDYHMAPMRTFVLKVCSESWLNCKALPR